MTDSDELRLRFGTPKPTSITELRDAEVRDRCHALAVALDGLMPPSRESGMALIKLEEVMFWAAAAIERNEPGGTDTAAGPA
jgi:hypothetical protein